ncbi:hypothetical protein [Frankia sp. CiP1_Cm_nod1]
MIRDRLLARLRTDPRVGALAAGIERQVRAGELTPALAADRILETFLREPPGVASERPR